MSISLTCGPSGTVITGETEEELVSNVQAHAREHENTELSRERILAEIRGRDLEQPIDAAAWAAMKLSSAARPSCAVDGRRRLRAPTRPFKTSSPRWPLASKERPCLPSTPRRLRPTRSPAWKALWC
jgi:hypothetical protein